MDAADEIIERLARNMAADAMGEMQFIETQRIPARMAGHLVVAALSRAAMKVQRKVDEACHDD
jgi:hypothetical protein